MIISAEVGLAHCGCLGTALAYVKAIAAAGADAAKFQDHLGDKCNRFRPGMENAFPQDIDRKAYWIRTGFALPEWAKIREACREQGIEYIVSPFSMEAFTRQEQLNPDRWKIASSKVKDYELIDACVKTGKPVILSSGMSDIKEVIDVRKKIPAYQAITLHCVTAYPTPPESACLGALKHEFDGISDHSGTIYPSLAAAVLGCEMAEVHVVFSRECFGPDVSSSITIAELKQLAEGVQFIDRAFSGNRSDVICETRKLREVFCA